MRVKRLGKQSQQILIIEKLQTIIVILKILMQKARIKLTSPDFKQLDDIARQIIDVADKTGVKHSGAIPLPVKKLTVPTRKSPCGGGTESYEKWQLRIHKRLIDIESDERTLRRIMRVEIPQNVHVEIELKGE